MRARALCFLCVLSATGCINPTNPFDPETPPEGRQPGSVTGRVLAIRAPVEGVEAPGLCDKGLDVDGDHEGFTIALRPLSDDAEIDIGVETQATNASGKFVLRNIPPGRYSFEVFADGFFVPPPAEVTVPVGATLERTLCAFDASPPAAPLLAPLPVVIDGDDEVVVGVLAPEPGSTYRVVAQAENGTTDSSEQIAADTALAFAVALGRGDPGRTLWTVTVTATDALGNTSDATSVAITRDAIAPLAPGNLRVSAARDRVFVSFDPVGDVIDVATEQLLDDRAVGYRVSYGVTARPFAAAAACPYGTPGDAVIDAAFFAVEGPSPVTSAETQLTLSGLVPGTELFLYVAAVDAAGNAGCYAAPVRARPDEVTFQRVADLGPSRPDARALLFLPGSTGGASSGGYVVVGGDDVLVIDATRTEHIVDIDVGDVATTGDALVFAAAALGSITVPLDALGVPGVPTTATGANVNGVAGEPGRAWTAAQGGLFFEGAQVGTGAFADVLLPGALAIGVRTSPAGVIVIDRATDTERNAASFNGTPVDAAVVGEHVVVALEDAGVRAISIGACLAPGAGPCAADVGGRLLPGSERADAVGALDDLALVGTAQGSVFALELPSLQARGRIDFGAPVRAIVSDDLGFCAALDTGPGGELPVVACATVASFPLQDSEVRVATSGGAVSIATSSGWAWAATGDGIDELALGAAPAVRTIPGPGAVSDVAASGGAAFVLREDGMVLHLLPGRAPTPSIDLASELTGHAPPFAGYLVVSGRRLVVAMTDAADEGVLLTATLTAAADGAVTATIDDQLDLGALRGVNELLLHAGRAYVATAPVGILAVDLDPLTLGADSALPAPDPNGVSFAAGLALVGAADAPTVIAPIRDASALDGFSALGTATLIGVPAQTPAGVNGLVRAGRFVAATTFGSGAFLLDGLDAAAPSATPVLSLPSVGAVQEGAPSARGVVFADGSGGVAWLRLR